MFIKIKGQIVNLDLVKKISEVTPYRMYKYELKLEDYSWMKEIKGPSEEAEFLLKSANGTEEERQVVVVYAINIHHFQRNRYDEDVTRIVIGTSRIEARKMLEALVKKLNGNISGIEEITA